MKRSMEGYIPVVSYATEVEGRLGQAALAAAGIESYLKYEDAGGMYPFMQQTEGVHLLVKPEDAEEAKAVLTTPATEDDAP